MKIRIRFRKYGVMKFIGHLDVMRYFQKAMRRAHIDICYSEGFSPHQIMSFAAPLGVGITSDGEYMDIEVHSAPSSEEMKKKLNDTMEESLRALNGVMVEGVECTGYVKLPDQAKTAMSIVAAADYDLYFKEGYAAPVSVSAFADGIRDFFEKPDEVLITKQTKKSERVLDIKPLIYGFQVTDRGGVPSFYLKLSTGSTDNLKPELVLEALFLHMGLTYDPNAIQIHRKDVYASDGDDFVSLGAMGEVIE